MNTQAKNSIANVPTPFSKPEENLNVRRTPQCVHTFNVLYVESIVPRSCRPPGVLWKEQRFPDGDWFVTSSPVYECGQSVPEQASRCCFSRQRNTFRIALMRDAIGPQSTTATVGYFPDISTRLWISAFVLLGMQSQVSPRGPTCLKLRAIYNAGSLRFRSMAPLLLAIK
jgi:hypothetical protein